MLTHRRLSVAPASTLIWAAALWGLFLVVLAVIALAGPGRIDICDGQTRYEVARSLVEHGDSVIRDPAVRFAVLPGRNGQDYSVYRFPQSVCGVAAIIVSDLTGPMAEARRHFFFVLTSAVAGAALAVTYGVFFRNLGLSPAAAVSWAAAGVFCTPNWFYATSTYDDVLGSLTVVAAVAVAFLTRRRQSLWGAAGAGLLLGLAYNCKQPLGAFVLPALAASVDFAQPLRPQVRRLILVLVGLGLGVAVAAGYDLYKFPPSTAAARTEQLKQYTPLFFGNPGAALVSLAVSPGAGILWYCPPLLLSLFGLRTWYREERWFCGACLAAVTICVGFLSLLTIYKGDWAWGPRYLTPVVALLWLLAPAGAAQLGRLRVATVLALGWLVQIAGLSVEPARLYVEHRLPAAFYLGRPWVYFDVKVSHLLNRPREISEILRADRTAAVAFSPAQGPTFACSALEGVPWGPEEIRKYHFLNSFRPWWISQRFLAPAERPVDLLRTVLLLLAVGMAGALALATALRYSAPALQTPAARHGGPGHAFNRTNHASYRSVT